ncbi:hypothetical protein [Bacillus salipaludis]|uniref:Uncharacterized protein n=1 Tax=Bacillus salipaludis TaxID=2547811 RepID=A0AA90TX18_9BACI|nr:hypothetical protein [Bacillus salipaludis]MDQ6601036.1 hypothetical protein [Bacillus salipaludis]
MENKSQIEQLNDYKIVQLKGHIIEQHSYGIMLKLEMYLKYRDGFVRIERKGYSC